MTTTEREIKAELDRIENYARQGHITVRECCDEMLRVYDRFDHDYETALWSGADTDGFYFNRCKTYHSIFLRLSRLTKE